MKGIKKASGEICAQSSGVFFFFFRATSYKSAWDALLWGIFTMPSIVVEHHAPDKTLYKVYVLNVTTVCSLLPTFSDPLGVKFQNPEPLWTTPLLASRGNLPFSRVLV